MAQQLAESAKVENKNIRQFFDHNIQQEEKKIHDIEDMLETISNSVRELQYFKGTNIIDFYKQQKEQENEYIKESTLAHQQMKHERPIFSALE